MTCFFTASVKSVRSNTLAQERRRPPRSGFHVNQYQRSGLQGAPAGGDDDIDRSYLGVNHGTIDDNVAVQNLLKDRLSQKVRR